MEISIITIWYRQIATDVSEHELWIDGHLICLMSAGDLHQLARAVTLAELDHGQYEHAEKRCSTCGKTEHLHQCAVCGEWTCCPKDHYHDNKAPIYLQ